MPKITVTIAGNVITATDGRITRKSVCATPGSARQLAGRLEHDRVLAAKWMKTPSPTQLELPLPIAPGIRPE